MENMMGELETNEELNIEVESVDTSDEETVDEISTASDSQDLSETTDIIEYKEVEEPCVSLTIISENKLTDAEVFVKRGIKYSIKAFFSAVVLTIMNLFI